MYGIKKYTVHKNLAFKIQMTEGINDFMNRFFLASGTFRRLPDGSFSKASFRGWVGSCNICLAFIFSAALYTVFLFVTNHLASCFENTSKFYSAILCIISYK